MNDQVLSDSNDYRFFKSVVRRANSTNTQQDTMTMLQCFRFIHSQHVQKQEISATLLAQKHHWAPHRNTKTTFTPRVFQTISNTAKPSKKKHFYKSHIEIKSQPFLFIQVIIYCHEHFLVCTQATTRAGVCTVGFTLEFMFVELCIYSWLTEALKVSRLLLQVKKKTTSKKLLLLVETESTTAMLALPPFLLKRNKWGILINLSIAPN